MNKQQIKAELRRSACEDEDPWCGLKGRAFSELIHWAGGDPTALISPGIIRIFCLLVAEAL